MFKIFEHLPNIIFNLDILFTQLDCSHRCEARGLLKIINVKQQKRDLSSFIVYCVFAFSNILTNIYLELLFSRQQNIHLKTCIDK